MIRIFKTGLSSSSDSPEVLTAELGQQTSPGRRGFGPKSSGHRSPGGGASILLNKRLTLPFLAFVAVLAAGLLFLMPGGLLQAQSGEQFFSYAENGTGLVATFTSTDPEGATPGYWMLTDEVVTDAVVDADIADRALFNIDQSGVLSFKEPRSYEDNSNMPPFKEYRVTVQVSDGSKIEYFKAYITVTDVEETGKITWTVTPSGGSPISGLQQFQPGAVLTPTVTDPDGATTVTAWKWYRGSTAISGAAGTGDTYTVVSADVGNHIRVEATYSDGNGPAETVSFTSPYPVQEFRRLTDNTVPAFSPTVVTRRVEENSKGNVGGPVTATDANGDMLTYTISGATPTNTFDHDGDSDTASIPRFTIDAATGQLMAAVKLDYETTNSYEVMVTATDSSGNVTDPVSTPTPATVTINVINVDEKPTFDTGSLAAGVVPAQTEGMTAIDADTTAGGTQPATLVASDPEGKKVNLSLMGNDAGSFELADDTDEGNDVSQVLSFMEKPDFEMPGDRNRDNVYEVTVRASDGTMNADRVLIIKVINDATESGKVTVSPEDAVVGVELTATLAHMEGGVSASGQITKPMWQWQRAEVPSNGGCDDVTTWNNIEDATENTYTPVSDDLSTATTPAGCLSAMVTYVYQFAPTDPATTARSVGTAVMVSQANQAPKFKEGTRTFRVVAEDVMANTDDDTTVDAGTNDPATNDNVGSPIVATDANGDDPTYTLSGAGASKFRVRSDGQLEVKDKLDHEMDSSHTVTLTANDGSGASNDSATITVTIYVTDVDEGPEIIVIPTENQAPVFRSSSTTRSIPEGQSSGRPIGARVTAIDPGDSLTYTLEGTDAASFSIDSGTGQLRTSAPLDQGTKSSYTVTVRATDSGRLYDTITVTITVTEAEEQMGEVTLWDGMVALTMAPQVGDTITGAVMDPDGGVTGESWQWSRTTTPAMMDSWVDIEGETNADYMVTASDTGYHLRVMATYTDAVGTDTAMEYSPATMMVGAEAEDPLLAEYDPDSDGTIEIEDMRKAVRLFFADQLSRSDMRRLVGIYFR